MFVQFINDRYSLDKWKSEVKMRARPLISFWISEIIHFMSSKFMNLNTFTIFYKYVIYMLTFTSIHQLNIISFHSNNPWQLIAIAIKPRVDYLTAFKQLHIIIFAMEFKWISQFNLNRFTHRAIARAPAERMLDLDLDEFHLAAWPILQRHLESPR